MVTLLLIDILFTVIISIILIQNYFELKPILSDDKSRPYSKKQNKDKPLVSICIPARNEGKNIRKCLNSIMNQNYPYLELLVLDDRSTDNTWSVLERVQHEYPEKIEIIKGKKKPEGWLGKSWACHQLSLKAKGNFLIFIDADVWLESKVITSVVQRFQEYNLDCLTVWPQQITLSFWEKVLVPLLYYTLLGFLITKYVNRTPRWIPSIMRKKLSPLFAAANGQFIAFKKGSYRKIDGHASVKNQIVEDVEIARQIKKAGFKIRMFHGIKSVYCRMYENESEIRNGFRKNFLAGFHYNLPIFFLAGLFHLMLYILPVILFLYAFILLNHTILLLTGFILLIIMAQRLLLSWWLKWDLLYVFTHFFAVLWFEYLGILSVLDYLLKREVKWKERNIKFEKTSY